MGAALLHPAYQVAKVIGHTGKAPMLRQPLDSDSALVTCRTAADLFVAGKGRDRHSVTIVDRSLGPAVEGIDRGYSLLTKTSLETIEPYPCLAASVNSSGMGPVGCSSLHEYSQGADRIHLALDFESSQRVEILVGLILSYTLVDSPAASWLRLPLQTGLTYSLVAWDKGCNKRVTLHADRRMWLDIAQMGNKR